MSIRAESLAGDMGTKRKPNCPNQAQHPSSPTKKPRKLDTAAGQESNAPAISISDWLQSTSDSHKDLTSPGTLVQKPGIPPETKEETLLNSSDLQVTSTSDRNASSPERLYLTRQTLKQINGDLSNMPPRKKSRQTRDKTPSAKSKKTRDSDSSDHTGKTQDSKSSHIVNGYDSQYCEALEKRLIYSYHDLVNDIPSAEQPLNMASMRKALYAKRSGPQPTTDMARAYRMTLRSSRHERKLDMVAIPLILPDYEIALDKNLRQAIGLQWRRDAMIEPQHQPAITAPAPDRTLGWHKRAFAAYANAIQDLGARACPISTEPLVFPLFAIEAKGAKGTLEVATLQSLHNGATMLSNLLYLRQNSNDTEAKLGEFFGRIHVLSFEITEQIIQMSGYWATFTPEIGVRYYGVMLDSWTPAKPDQYKEAYRCLRNAMEWVRSNAHSWIVNDLKTLNIPAEVSGDLYISQQHTPLSSRSEASKSI